MTNKDPQQVIQEVINSGRPVTLDSLASALNCSALEAAHLLPKETCTFAPGEDFEKVWESISQWEKATFIVIAGENVIEVETKVVCGKKAMGYYNLMGGKSPLQGHFKYENIIEIGFITMPFMGRESHFAAFFDKDGKCAYSFYVGREKHKLIESAKEQFLALQSSYR